ncbi:MAG: hypothetical protein IK024_00625 [Treponema sp.]|nr:hypothetical protein [Treponema sp.]
MKKYFLFCILSLLFISSIFSIEIGQKVYKSVLINDEKVYRWVNLDAITKYNSNGKITSYKSKYMEYFNEYDDKGNLIHYKDSNGLEEWMEYDDKGNLIHHKFNSGTEVWTQYNDDGNAIYAIDSEGNEYIWEYDENGQLIYWKEGKWYEEWILSDSEIRMIHYRQLETTDEDEEYIEEATLLQNGNNYHYYYADGTEEVFEYNDRYILIYAKHKDGTEERFDVNDVIYELNENKQIIHYKDSEQEYWREYDSKGNKTYFKNNSNEEIWYEYDYYPNGVIMIVREYRAV